MGAIFNIVLPTSWKELTDEQLIALFRLLAQQLTSEEIKTPLLVKWNKLRILAQKGKSEIPSKREQSQTSLSFAEREVFGGSQFLLKAKKAKPFFVSAVQIQYATTVLDFIDTIPDMPIRISKMGKYRALAANFEGVPFEKFLYLDNLFQGYLQTQKEDLIVQMTQILYDTDKKRIPKHFLVGAFYWFAALKQYLSRLFTHFFQPVQAENKNLLQTNKPLFEKLRESTNAQIRALTAGDITKEKIVLKMDTHRALTELDAKAREAEEIRKISKS